MKRKKSGQHALAGDASTTPQPQFPKPVKSLMPILSRWRADDMPGTTSVGNITAALSPWRPPPKFKPPRRPIPTKRELFRVLVANDRPAAVAALARAIFEQCSRGDFLAFWIELNLDPGPWYPLARLTDDSLVKLMAEIMNWGRQEAADDL